MRSRGKNLIGVMVVLGVVLVLHGPLLVHLQRMLTLEHIAYSWDSYTNYLRVIWTRDYYLPSGHHWGWDPFWFQGQVPFLLFPHLHYVLLALASALIPVSAERIFNIFILAAFLCLPLSAALPTLRTRGLAASLAVAAWAGTASCLYGAGSRGLLVVGLISQQLGLCLFALLAHDLLVALRTDRAGLWLGIIPLVHVHAALISAIAWAFMGLVYLARLPRRYADFKEWLAATGLALMIAAPSILGFALGWQRIGGRTSFGYPDIWKAIVSNTLVAPWPMVLAVCLGSLLAAFTSYPRLKARRLVALGVGAVLVALALQRLETGIYIADRLLRQILQLRALPFAFVWLAFAGVAGWYDMPRLGRGLIVALTICGVWVNWTDEVRLKKWVGRPFREGMVESVQSRQFGEAMAWVKADLGGETATILLLRHNYPGVGHPLQRLTDRLRMPTLDGHALELTAIQNTELAAEPTAVECGELRAALKRYAVGYVIGYTERFVLRVEERERLRHFTMCLGQSPAWRLGGWWIFGTGWHWGDYDKTVSRFAHDRTWTTLSWDLAGAERDRDLELPVAHSGRWTASAEGRAVPVATAQDGMVRVKLPAGARRLVMRYEGEPGEWLSVFVSAVAVVLAAWRVRSSSRRSRGEGSFRMAG